MSNTVAAVLGMVGVIIALVVAAIFIKDGQTLATISAIIVGTAIPAFISILQTNRSIDRADDAAHRAAHGRDIGLNNNIKLVELTSQIRALRSVVTPPTPNIPTDPNPNQPAYDYTPQDAPQSFPPPAYTGGGSE